MNESQVNTDAEFDKKLSTDSGKWKLPIVFALVGLVTGAATTALIRWQGAPAMIVTVHKSKYHDVDRTCEALRTALEEHGFGYKGALNLNKSMASHGVQLDRQVRVVQFGKAKYAHDMVMDNPKVSALMPCAFGVYKGNDGNVYISSINRNLIGKMFGGTVARVMGGYVAQDQAQILSACGEQMLR